MSSTGSSEVTPDHSGSGEFQARGASRKLVVLLHAYSLGSASLDQLRAVVAEKLPDADLFVPRLPLGVMSFHDPNAIAQSLLERIDGLWEQRRARGDRDGYESILLIGHSVGGLLARKVYVCACGETSMAPFEPPIQAADVRPWAKRVERIVLLAGMNRGWTISHHLSMKNAVLWSIGSAFLGVLSSLQRRRALILQVRRGAPFITQLRIQWLAMLRHAEQKEVGDALVVQLLGSIDDMVAPQDNTDLVTGRDFVYLDVPRSGHSNVVEMGGESPAAQGRREVFVHALRDTPEALGEQQIVPGDIRPREPDPRVTDVVFVIHGIRDQGYWTHKIARRTKALVQGDPDRKVATETSSYGYFPMLPFILYDRRRAKVEWLMDEYTENLALYPKADFSFIGHSNGTYLLAKALEEYPACRFRNVVFAGSVVRRRYSWQRLVQEGRVGRVLNFVATRDWVVALFPKAFETLRLQDLGGAGHDGFDSVPGQEVRYVRGGHGAALREDFWDAIAHFVVHGELGELDPEQILPRRSRFLAAVGAVAPAVWVLGLGLLVWLGWWIWNLSPTEPLRTLTLAAYVLGIWLVATRV